MITICFSYKLISFSKIPVMLQAIMAHTAKNIPAQIYTIISPLIIYSNIHIVAISEYTHIPKATCSLLPRKQQALIINFKKEVQA